MQQLPETGYLRLPQIIGRPAKGNEPGSPAIIPVSRSTWWAGVKAGRYPQPVRTLGQRITAWRVEDIRALIARADSHTSLQAQVEQKIGRNLLRYQLVELRLKHALPLRRITISAEGLDALGDDVKAQNRSTPGQLLPEYAEAFEIGPPGAKQAFQVELDAFLEARNRLVHHLLQDYTLSERPVLAPTDTGVDELRLRYTS